MAHTLSRVRGAVGIGLTWAAAWGVAGAIVALGFVLRTGSRPDPPFPLMFAAFGLIAGLIFAAGLHFVGGHRPFDQLSLPRFAAWGAVVAFLLSAVFVLTVASAGDSTFIWNLVALGPTFAAGGAACAAGSLVLARRTQRWRSLLIHLGGDAASHS